MKTFVNRTSETAWSVALPIMVVSKPPSPLSVYLQNSNNNNTSNISNNNQKKTTHMKRRYSTTTQYFRSIRLIRPRYLPLWRIITVKLLQKQHETLSHSETRTWDRRNEHLESTRVSRRPDRCTCRMGWSAWRTAGSTARESMEYPWRAPVQWCWCTQYPRPPPSRRRGCLLSIHSRESTCLSRMWCWQPERCRARTQSLGSFQTPASATRWQVQAIKWGS